MKIAFVVALSCLVAVHAATIATVKSDRVGDNFAYSTVESTVPNTPYVYAYAPITTLQGYQPILSQQPIYAPPVLFNPIFGSLFGQNPLYPGGIAQYPILQNPSPILQPQPQPPMIEQPQDQQPVNQGPLLSPTPVQGTIIDDDTVAVESA